MDDNTSSVTDHLDSQRNRIEAPPEQPHDIILVPRPTEKLLNERQIIDYHNHRHGLCKWMVNLGKNPQTATGYAFETARRRAHQLDRFYRFVWDRNGGYTTKMTHEHADAFAQELAYADHSETHKANAQKALKMYFRWRSDTVEWEPQISFTGDTGRSRPREFFTVDERKALRETALEHGTVPSYNHLDSSERQEWTRLLAQRYSMAMDDVGPKQFNRANGFKIPSMVWVSLDTGLRPVEVGRARVSWVDAENSLLRIPTEESSKNRDNWKPALLDRTTQMVKRWVTERDLYEKYADSDRLWLTREGNPYGSDALNYVLESLCETAGIDTSNRDLSWYAIRHSLGTAMADERGLEAAAEQLRHNSINTTRKYDNVPAEERREALDNIG